MLNVWTMLSIWLASLQVISAPNMCSHNTSVLNDIWWSLWAVHHTASCNCTMWKKRPYHYHYHSILHIPSRELTYPTWGKGKSSSKVPWKRDMLVPWRVTQTNSKHQKPPSTLAATPTTTTNNTQHAYWETRNTYIHKTTETTNDNNDNNNNNNNNNNNQQPSNI